MTEMHRQPQPESDDEISLVDLISTFLKHRRVFYIVFISVLSLGLLYAFFMPQKYDYVSLVKLAEKDAGTPIEKPIAVIATLENRWLPEYQFAYYAEHNEVMPFEVRFENPESTALIRVSSEATVGQSDAVENAHVQLIEELEQAQSAAVSSLKQNLKGRIESLSGMVEVLEGYEDAGVAIAAAVEKRLSLDATLDSIRPMEVLASTRKKSEPNGPARSLIIALAGMLGLMGGVFLSFFVEFASLVKARVTDS